MRLLKSLDDNNMLNSDEKRYSNVPKRIQISSDYVSPLKSSDIKLRISEEPTSTKRQRRFGSAIRDHSQNRIGLPNDVKSRCPSGEYGTSSHHLIAGYNRSNKQTLSNQIKAILTESQMNSSAIVFDSKPNIKKFATIQDTKLRRIESNLRRYSTKIITNNPSNRNINSSILGCSSSTKNRSFRDSEIVDQRTKDYVVELESENKELKAKNALQEKFTEGLKKKYQNYKDELSKTTARCIKLENELKQAEEELQDAVTQLQQANQEKDTVCLEASRMVDTNEELKSLVSRLENECNQKDTTLKELYSLNAELQSEITSSKEVTLSSSERQADLASKVIVLEKQKVSHTAKIVSLQTKLSNLEYSLESKVEELKARSSMLDTLTKNLQEKTLSSSEKQIKITQLEKEIAELQFILKDSHQKIDGADEECLTLRNLLKAAEEEKKTSESLGKNALTDLYSLINDYEKLEEERNMLINKISGLEKDNQRMANSLKDHGVSFSFARSKLGSSAYEVTEKIVIENQDFASQTKELSIQLEDYKESTKKAEETYRLKIEEFQDILNSKESTIQEITSELNKLQNDHQLLLTCLSKKDEEMSSMAATIGDLKQQIIVHSINEVALKEDRSCDLAQHEDASNERLLVEIESLKETIEYLEETISDNKTAHKIKLEDLLADKKIIEDKYSKSKTLLRLRGDEIDVLREELATLIARNDKSTADLHEDMELNGADNSSATNLSILSLMRKEIAKRDDLILLRDTEIQVLVDALAEMDTKAYFNQKEPKESTLNAIQEEEEAGYSEDEEQDSVNNQVEKLLDSNSLLKRELQDLKQDLKRAESVALNNKIHKHQSQDINEAQQQEYEGEVEENARLFGAPVEDN